MTNKGTTTVLAERTGIPVNALWARTALLLDAPNNGVATTLTSAASTPAAFAGAALGAGRRRP